MFLNSITAIRGLVDFPSAAAGEADKAETRTRPENAPTARAMRCMKPSRRSRRATINPKPESLLITAADGGRASRKATNATLIARVHACAREACRKAAALACLDSGFIEQLGP